MQPFDKCTIRIVVKENPRLILRAAIENDLEQLRHWKNGHRKFFFHQEVITEEQQKSWFAAYLDSPHDFMLMTELEGQPFGCMGIRWQEKNWDVYNVILGLQEYGGLGFMGTAFESMLAFSRTVKLAPITLQVLKQNPAVEWYLKHGFYITQVHDNHYLMSHRNSKLKEDSP